MLIHAQQTVGVFSNDSGSLNGYTLFTVAGSTYLVDNCGELVNSWAHEAPPGLSTYLTDEGDLYRCNRVAGGFTGGGTGGLITRQNWEGELEWSYLYANEEHQHHHDIEVMPNGHILVIAWDSVEDPQSKGALGTTPYAPLEVTEVMQTGPDTGEIVWRWSAWDHLVQNVSEEFPDFGEPSDFPRRIDVNAYPPQGNFSTGDWIHCNAVSYNAERDEIALSSRDFGEIWVIDHSTTTEEAASSTGGDRGYGGDLLYRWGNPQAYGRGAPEDQVFFGQHDIKWVPEGHPLAGQFSVFNNGTGVGGPFVSAIDIFDPPLDSSGDYVLEAGSPFGPTEVSWRYTDDIDPSSFFSQNQAGADPLPNGNVLACVTTKGEIREVDFEGNMVWQYFMPISNGAPLNQGDNWSPTLGTTFRATRLAADHPGLAGRDLTPMGTIEIGAGEYDCSIFVGLAESRPLEMDAHLSFMADGILLVNDLAGVLTVEIFDLNGRKVLEEIAQPGRSQIDTALDSKSIYIIRLIDDSGARMVSRRFATF